MCKAGKYYKANGVRRFNGILAYKGKQEEKEEGMCVLLGVLEETRRKREAENGEV